MEFYLSQVTILLNNTGGGGDLWNNSYSLFYINLILNEFMEIDTI